jgi:hypothetical protein
MWKFVSHFKGRIHNQSHDAQNSETQKGRYNRRTEKTERKDTTRNKLEQMEDNIGHV